MLNFLSKILQTPPSLKRCLVKESVVLLFSSCFLKSVAAETMLFRKIFFSSLVFVCLMSTPLPVSGSLVSFQSLVQQVKSSETDLSQGLH